jgi:hypothetical protein
MHVCQQHTRAAGVTGARLREPSQYIERKMPRARNELHSQQPSTHRPPAPDAHDRVALPAMRAVAEAGAATEVTSNACVCASTWQTQQRVALMATQAGTMARLHTHRRTLSACPADGGVWQACTAALPHTHTHKSSHVHTHRARRAASPGWLQPTATRQHAHARTTTPRDDEMCCSCGFCCCGPTCCDTCQLLITAVNTRRTTQMLRAPYAHSPAHIPQHPTASASRPVEQGGYNNTECQRRSVQCAAW